MTSPQEQLDLDTMKAKIQEIELNSFRLLKTLNTLPRVQLDSAGYKGKTNAEAMQMAFRDSLAKIDRVQKEFVKKYPD
jgi:hypothetical protein